MLPKRAGLVIIPLPSSGGLTRADILGLRWQDINFEAGSVTVSQGRVYLQFEQDKEKRSVTGDTKSAQRRREIPVEAVHPGTMDLLEKLKALQAEERLAAGNAYNRANEYIVVNELDDPVRPEWYSDQFHRISKRASVKDSRLHSVRHSLAFWLHQNGVAPADAATFLGHTVGGSSFYLSPRF